ncbi:MAG: SRPBCC family protein [Bacteroidota bacterium]
MTTIDSEKVSIAAPASALYSFLGDFDRLKDLMPPQISKWQSTADSCSFNIQGMADIELRMAEKIPYSLIRVASEGRSPFSFSMIWRFEEVASGAITSLSIEADLNPMMSMMVKSPLQNFVNILVTRLKEVVEASRA